MADRRTELAARMVERAERQLARAGRFMQDSEDDTTEMEAEVENARSSILASLDKAGEIVPNVTARRAALPERPARPER